MDAKALSANFWHKYQSSVKAASVATFTSSPAVGGNGGSPFDDSTGAVDSNITAIHVRCGAMIDAIGVQYEGASAPRMHGGNGGHLEIFNLLSDEKIIRIEGRSGARVDQLCFITSKGRKSPIYGGNGGGAFLLDGNGHPLRYFAGRSGADLDRLEAHWWNYVLDISLQAIPSTLVGGTGGSPFDDSTAVDVTKRISSITVHSGAAVDAIQVIYDGQPAPSHGGTGGDNHTFDLGPDESIIRIEGRSGARLDRIQFITNQGRTSPLYGGDGGDPFLLDGDSKVLKYFDGRSGARVDALRAYWWPIAPTAYYAKNVKYSISEAQILGAPPEVVGSIFLANNSSVQQTASQNCSVSATETSSWSSTVGAKVGVKTSFSCGLPGLADGKVEVSVEASYSYTWGETKSTTKVIGQVVSANIPPNRQMKVNFVAQKANLDVPYSATFVTEFSNGTKKEEIINGVYKGVCVSGLTVEYGKDTPIT